MFLLCQNAALEQNKEVPVRSREAKRLSGMLGWKIQAQFEAAHRAGGSLRLVWSCPSQLCLKCSLFLIGLRSFPLQSLEKDGPAVIMQEELNTGISVNSMNAPCVRFKNYLKKIFPKWCLSEVAELLCSDHIPGKWMWLRLPGFTVGSFVD